MSALPVTALYAGPLALLVVGLALRVALKRMKGRIALGDDGDPVMKRAIRAHGNAAETIPLALILLALCEAAGAPGWALHLYGLALLAGRGMHAWHFSARGAPLALRSAGMGLTLTAMGCAALGLAAWGLGALM